MTLYILLGIIAALTLAWNIYIWRTNYYCWWEYIVYPLLQWLAAAVVAALVLMILGEVARIGAEWRETETSSVPLVALQTRDTVEGAVHGSLFGAYGYVNGERVLSYTTRGADGGIRLGYVDVDRAVVYERDAAPKLVTHHWETTSNPWIVPDWGAHPATSKTYDVIVPAGSVVESFQVAP